MPQDVRCVHALHIPTSSGASEFKATTDVTGPGQKPDYYAALLALLKLDDLRQRGITETEFEERKKKMLAGD